jgi:hypothetical protein
VTTRAWWFAVGITMAAVAGATAVRAHRTSAAKPARLPAFVWIQPRSTVRDWTPASVAAAERGIAEWNGIDPSVSFVVTDDSADADVRVWWTDRFADAMSGESRLEQGDDGRASSATVTLAVHHRDGRMLDTGEVRALTIHEFGHLLGLPHAADPASIMAPTVRVRTLSPRDSAALRSRATAEP